VKRIQAALATAQGMISKVVMAALYEPSPSDWQSVVTKTALDLWNERVDLESDRGHQIVFNELLAAAKFGKPIEKWTDNGGDFSGGFVQAMLRYAGFNEALDVLSTRSAIEDYAGYKQWRSAVDLSTGNISETTALHARCGGPRVIGRPGVVMPQSGDILVALDEPGSNVHGFMALCLVGSTASAVGTAITCGEDVIFPDGSRGFGVGLMRFTFEDGLFDYCIRPAAEDFNPRIAYFSKSREAIACAKAAKANATREEGVLRMDDTTAKSEAEVN
jgi:hypothetical protein